jgi:hypothetical protein
MTASTKDEFMARVKSSDPMNYVLRHEQVEYYATKHYAPQKAPYTPQFTEFRRVPQEMTDWVKTEFLKKDRPKTLVVWGPSRTGKTCWARSLGNHSYLGYAWSIKEVHQDSDYIVIDDVEMTKFNLWQPFLGK